MLDLAKVMIKNYYKELDLIIIRALKHAGIINGDSWSEDELKSFFVENNVVLKKLKTQNYSYRENVYIPENHAYLYANGKIIAQWKELCQFEIIDVCYFPIGLDRII